LKIGILSLYYKNMNYGGLLQAYALTEIINRQNHEAEQVCYDMFTPSGSQITLGKLFRYGILYMLRILRYPFDALCKKNIYTRHSALVQFQEMIPHSKQVYTTNTMQNTLPLYDQFVTGSDQVWNMSWYREAFFLSFAPKEKHPFSYAASMPNTDLTEAQKNIVCNHLKKLQDVSVREAETADFLTQLINRPVHTVLDPTLLLTKQDWDEICAKPLLKEKYMFCYFLGTSRKQRKTAERFARKKQLTLVTLPHLCGACVSDIRFGDKRLYDVSPQQFLSLIKHAEYVLTDSFHAVVFANMYQTKFIVFDRVGTCKMSSRITHILHLFGCPERLCTDEKHALSYIFAHIDMPLSGFSEEFLTLKEESLAFLERNLLQNKEDDR